MGIRRLELFSRQPRVLGEDGLLSVGKGLEKIGTGLPSIWQRCSQKGLGMNLYGKTTHDATKRRDHRGYSQVGTLFRD